MSNLARQPLQIVEIDVDYCSLTYGTGSCTAALSADTPRKCYNTYFTCQDRTNFNKGTLTLRFARNMSGLPKGQTIFPALQSVSTNPAMISLGGVDDRTGSLGKRARVTVTLKDFAYSDALTDKYAAERITGAAMFSGVGRDPDFMGMFFGTLRARSPYYFGRALRVKNGFVGDNIATMDTDHYVITGWAGPTAGGAVTFTAQDPVKLTDKEYALCPKPSTGKLAEDVAATGKPTFDLIPPGVGGEYASSGQASIGNEIVAFTRSGDAITLTARSVGGSVDEAHSEGDTFQQCYVAGNAEPADVIEDLLENYANVSSAWSDKTAWQAELRRWAANLRLTRTIPKPTPVITLLGQIMDMGIMIIPDTRAKKIRVRVNRPVDLDETAASITDENAIIEGSVSRSDLDDKRLSQVWSIHRLINYADSHTDTDNYKVLEPEHDLEAEGSLEYDQSKIHRIHMPWLGRNGNRTIASVTADRMLTHYRDTPQKIEFTADHKNRDDLGLGNLITVSTRVLIDEDGLPLPTGMRVVSVEDDNPGHTIKVTAESYKFDGRWGWMHNTGYTTDYDGASATELAEGCFMIDGNAFPDGTGPYIMF